MKQLVVLISIFCFYFWNNYSQETNALVLFQQEEKDFDHFVGIDKFDNTYHISDNTLFKINSSEEEIAFQDLLLGDISRVDILNPNKIIVFYQMANVVVILDNRLTEIDRQDFNKMTPFKNVGHVGSSKDQSLWIYNIDLNQLELFDYRYDRSIAQSLPLDEDIIDIKNNFNFCYLQTASGIYVYNIYGSLLHKISIESIYGFDVFKNKLVVHSNKGLAFYNQYFDLVEVIKVDFEDYNSLFYKDENLYLYDGKILNYYEIISKK
jgi:hypothetical protein